MDTLPTTVPRPVLSFLCSKSNKKVCVAKAIRRSVTLGRRPRKVFSILLCFWVLKVYPPRQMRSSLWPSLGPWNSSWGNSQSSLLVSVPLPFFAFSELFFFSLGV